MRETHATQSKRHVGGVSRRIETKTPHDHVADLPLAELIECAKGGDRAALDLVLRSARPRAMAVAMRVLKNVDDAEDAVQDAFVKVVRSIGRFEERSAFTTWLHRIVVNACLDTLRRHEARRLDAAPEHDADQDVESAPVPAGVEYETPEVSLERARARALVRAAVTELSPVHAEALTLREFDDLSYTEIAERAGCPVGTVMSRLHHARHRLADGLRLTFSGGILEAA